MQSLFSELTSETKPKLKPTATVERHIPCVGRSDALTAAGPQESSRDMTEYYDKPEVFQRNIKKLADAIRASPSVTIYTGAGISTACAIPDYRGTKGHWTKLAKGETPLPMPDLNTVHPSAGHMVIRALVASGKAKMVVSTNIDGLHRRSGLPAEQLSELHGNAFLEQCSSCQKEYLRDFNCLNADRHPGSHLTTRQCDACQSDLTDSIVHFGESLPEKELAKAGAASHADLALVVGTSMLVQPANQFPLQARQMAIINRQKTPFDSRCAVRLHGDSDDALLALAAELGLQVPTHTLGGHEVVLPEVAHATKYQAFLPQLAKIQAQKARITVGGRSQHLVQERRDETVKLDAATVPRNSMLYIQDCSGATFHVEATTVKVVLHRLTGCQVHLPKTIITNCLEIIECEDVTVHVSMPAGTITVDLTTGCTLHLPSTDPSLALYLSCSENVRASHPGLGEHCVAVEFPELEAEREEGDAPPQFVSRWVGDGNALLTEQVVREGAGYATTARQKKIADAKQAQLEKALKKMLFRQ